MTRRLAAARSLLRNFGPVTARLAASGHQFWTRVFRILEDDFGGMPVFFGDDGEPRVFVVGGEDRVVILFATLPELLVRSLVGLRACEVIAHSAFASGSLNGELLIVEAVTGARPGERPEILILTFENPLDVTEAR